MEALTGVHHQVPADLWFPVVPGRLEAVSEADAKAFEVPFADQGLWRASGDESAFDGQHQGWAGVKVARVIRLQNTSEKKRTKGDKLFSLEVLVGVLGTKTQKGSSPKSCIEKQLWKMPTFKTRGATCCQPPTHGFPLPLSPTRSAQRQTHPTAACRLSIRAAKQRPLCPLGPYSFCALTHVCENVLLRISPKLWKFLLYPGYR